MKLLIKKGVTSKLLRVFIQNNSVTTGAGLTGLVFNSGSLIANYIREGDASPTAITLATMTVGTWATGGFKEVSSSVMPGVYEIGIPNAVLASGANSVVIVLMSATNMAQVVIEIQLVDVDLQDTVRFGLTALPNAAAGASGGLPTGDANGRVGIQAGTGAGQLDFTSGVVKSNLVQILATALTETAGQLAGGFKKLFDVASPVFTLLSVNQTGDSFTRIGTNGAGLTALGDTRIANLDATVSSRSTYAGGDTSGTTTLLARLTAIRAGLLDNLDAAISTRLASGSYTAPDNTTIATINTKIGTPISSVSADIATRAPSATALSTVQWTNTRAANLDNLDVAVSTRLAGGSYTTPPTATAIRTEIDANSTKLDVAVSTRLASGSYVAPDNAGISTINTNLSTVNSNVLTRAPSSTAVSNADLTPTRSAKLDNLDTTVSSRSTLTAANVWAFVIEGALTAQGVLRLILASVTGKLSGAATTTIRIRDVADSKDRVVATVDSDGNRSAVTLDQS